MHPQCRIEPPAQDDGRGVVGSGRDARYGGLAYRLHGPIPGPLTKYEGSFKGTVKASFQGSLRVLFRVL